MTESHGTVLERLEDESLFGIPIALIDTVSVETDADGEEIYTILAHDELTAAVPLARALVPVALDGQALAALRRACGLSGAAFARAAGMNPSTLSRLEAATQGMGDYLEKLLRIYVAEELHTRAPGVGFQARAIVTMKLMPVCGERVRITLERLPVRVDGSVGEHYAEAA